uniref:Atlastin GTPase 3 n=1 Tax=Pseudonaja textilis TaxID=8673 RepID=A0A670ZJR4_PSETE
WGLARTFTPPHRLTCRSPLPLQICGGDKPYVAPELLEVKHREQSTRALEHFRRIKKMGGREFSQRYEDELMQEMSDLFEDLAKHNQSKNIFNTFRTPAILFGVIVVLYVASGVTEYVGLSLAAQLCNLLVGLLLLSLLAWGYIRYSGEYRELGIAIDSTAEFVLQKIRAVGYVVGLVTRVGRGVGRGEALFGTSIPNGPRWAQPSVLPSSVK